MEGTWGARGASACRRAQVRGVWRGGTWGWEGRWRLGEGTWGVRRANLCRRAKVRGVWCAMVAGHGPGEQVGREARAHRGRVSMVASRPSRLPRTRCLAKPSPLRRLDAYVERARLSPDGLLTQDDVEDLVHELEEPGLQHPLTELRNR